jgi:undecaprenyl-diphosphatase
LPDGKGLTVIVNAEAGSALNGGAGGPLRERLPRARVVETDEGADLPDVLAAEADDGIDALGIVGGDGSVNTAAQAALDLGVPLVVVPSGTLNHLARDLGLDGVDDAVAAIARGDVVEIDVGRLDGRPFLNTAAFGAYPDLVDARERIEDRIGKWPAFVLALVRVARRAEPCDVELDGRRRRVWMVFVGNCCYHPSGFAPSWRERLDDGRLDVRVVDASRRLARTRLLFAALSGRLGRSRVYEQSLVRHLEVRSCEGPLRVALDGETLDASPEFVVDKAPERLRVFVPAR